MEDKKLRNRGVALWAGITAFFTNLVALKALALIAGGDVRIGISALLTSFAVAGAIYAKERLNAAKDE